MGCWCKITGRGAECGQMAVLGPAAPPHRPNGGKESEESEDGEDQDSEPRAKQCHRDLDDEEYGQGEPLFGCGFVSVAAVFRFHGQRLAPGHGANGDISNVSDGVGEGTPIEKTEDARIGPVA